VRHRTVRGCRSAYHQCIGRLLAGLACRDRSVSFNAQSPRTESPCGCGPFTDTEITMTQAKSRTAPIARDAISILTDDHKKVKKMFMDFEKLMKAGARDSEKGALVARICEELTIHTDIEEEIFYPAVRAAIDADDLMDEADVEHAGARQLIAQLEQMEPGDDHYDAKVTVLGENIDHHVKEEQDEMFPKARKAKLDLDALGTQMLALKRRMLERGGAVVVKKNARVA
jgi:hemerythrin-like domain-containing protein